MFYELKDKEGNLEQALIPIGTEMQIRLAKEHNSDTYTFDIIPIEYKEEEYSATVIIEKNLHTDIASTLHTPLWQIKWDNFLKAQSMQQNLRREIKFPFCTLKKQGWVNPMIHHKLK